MITNTTDATFNADVLSSPIPVLLDFWAPWCGPCRMVAPILEELAPAYAGKIAIVKLNTDDNPKTAEQYGIRSIPTLMLFRDGEMISHRVGALSKASLEEWFASSL